MTLLVNKIFKLISTVSPRNLTKYGIVQRRTSLKFATNLRYKHNSAKKITDPSGSCIRKTLNSPIQCAKNKKHRKVSIIGGGGNIGQITGYDLLLKRSCDEIVLFDSKRAVNGAAVDMLDGVSLRDHPNIKMCTTGEQTKNSDLVIICAGKSVPNGKNQSETLQDNIDIFRKLIPKLAYLSPNCVILVATNPVDLMTYAAWKFSGFPFQRVVGTGTELDTSRFKYFLSKRLGISPKCINAWIIGEHGLSCVPCWSTINVAGTRLRDIHTSFGLKNDPDNWVELEEEVKHNANNIKKIKGFNSYSKAMTISFIAQAILSDAKTIHAVSTCCNGVHGFKVKSFLSLPAVIGSSGVNYIVRQVLDCNEKEKLIKSATILDKALLSIKW